VKKTIFRIAGALAALAAPLAISTAAHAATLTWTGGGTPVSTEYMMADAANWGGGVVVSGDILNIPMSVSADKRILNNNLPPGTTLAGINFSGTNADCTTNGLTINGTSLIVLTGNITDTVTGDCVVKINNSIQLNAPISISNTGDSHIAIGKNDGSDTLVMATNDLTINGGVNGMFINSQKTGTSSISISGSIILSNNSPAYDGAITLASGANVTAKVPGVLGTTVGGTTVSSGSTLTLCSPTSGSSTVIYPEPLTVGGEGFVYQDGSKGGALQLTAFCGFGVGGTYTPANTEFTGNIVLTSNTVVNAADNMKISGPISGAYTITTIAGSTGTLTMASSANTSLTPNGTQAVQQTTTTITDSLPNLDIAVGQTEIVILNGVRKDVDVVGTLKGTGTVGALRVMPGGHLAPGQSPGCINSGNLTLSGIYDVELGGLTVCTQYDQTKVTGTVDLNGSTLNVIRYNNMVPRLNNTFTIIDNDGADAVTGTFTGLAQGATTTVDGITYTVSYTGGTGNDVVLTVTGVSASLGAPNTGFLALKASVILPMLAVVAGAGVVTMQYATAKRKK
jgi:fibronectin-binding autotransporter adhesin